MATGIMVGDSVLLENGRTPGIVDFIVTTPEEMKATNVQESGVMIKSLYTSGYVAHEFNR
jgi:hypothetical protein